MAIGSSGTTTDPAVSRTPPSLPIPSSTTTSTHHGILSSAATPTTILIIVLLSLVATIVTSVLLFIAICRAKSSRSKNATIEDGNPINFCRQHHNPVDGGHYANNARSIGITRPADARNCSITRGGLGFPTRLMKNNSGAQVFRYKELEMATDGFCKENVIGFGGFGTVYRGVLGDGTVAAIKMLNKEGRQGEREFRIEVDLLNRLHSSYLVQLLGYCADQQHRLLVFEFMPNGSLQSHLHASSHNQQHQEPLGWGTRLQIALDCAQALEFLHERTVPSVIHRDFKCSNILLDTNFRAKVSDFGMAKLGSDKLNGQVVTRVLGTTGYVAPEYASTGKLTTKSDVYSYGVVLLELLTGRLPVDMKLPAGKQVLVSWALPRLTNRQKVVEMVDPALQGQYSKKDLIQVAAIAAVCVQPEADYRPLMTDIVQSLIPLVRSPSATCPPTPSRLQHN